MSKRLFTLISVGLLLVLSTVAYAQEKPGVVVTQTSSLSQQHEVAGLTQGGNYVTGPAGQPIPAQGIIMSDGRICDPIRHMGC
jgi:hypothetical protein